MSQGAIERYRWPFDEDAAPIDTGPRWPEGTYDVRSLAGARSRLLIPRFTERETRAEYEERGGYAPGATGFDLIEMVGEAGLLGRGGAAFPTGLKLRSVVERPGPRYVVANAEEGEPLSAKDRWLTRIRPHLILDGLFRAAQATGASGAFVYVSDQCAAASVLEALGELSQVPVPIEVVRVARSYVGGEETAVVRAINGGPALPTDKPPRPFEAGIDGQPTLVANVETLANLPSIDRLGAEEFLDSSIDRASAGTFLLTLSGFCQRPGLYEVPLGLRLGDVIEEAGGLAGEPRGALMGGFFGGIIGPRFLDLRLSYPVLRAEGTGLGCGAIWVLGSDDCPVQVAAEVMGFFANNNARQCGACIRGTTAMSTVLERLCTGTVASEELARLEAWSVSLRHRGACAHLDGGANLAATLLREFPVDVREHASSSCPICADWNVRPSASSRFEFSLEASGSPSGE